MTGVRCPAAVPGFFASRIPFFWRRTIHLHRLSNGRVRVRVRLPGFISRRLRAPGFVTVENPFPGCHLPGTGSGFGRLWPRTYFRWSRSPGLDMGILFLVGTKKSLDMFGPRHSNLACNFPAVATAKIPFLHLLTRYVFTCSAHIRPILEVSIANGSGAGRCLRTYFRRDQGEEICYSCGNVCGTR